MAPGTSAPDDGVSNPGEKILAPEELALLRTRRIDAPGASNRWEFGHGLAGLAFSGGGIRSAVFNLGLLQALLRCRLFRRFHYLSTVSGGGYLGSMVSAHARVDPGARDPGLGFPYAPQATELDRGLLRYVREHCRYLTPSNGGRLGDLLGFGIALLRGLLSHVLLASVFFGLLAVPFFILSPEAFPRPDDIAPHLPRAAGMTALLVVALALGTLFWERVFSGRARKLCNGLLKLGLALLLLELALYGHWRLERAKLELAQHLAAGILGTGGLAGAFAALRGAAGAFETWSRWRRVLLRAAPYVVVLGLGYFLLWVFQSGLFRLVADQAPPAAPVLFAEWCNLVVHRLEKAQFWASLVLFATIAAHALVLFAGPPPGRKRVGGRRLQVVLYALGSSLVFLPALLPAAGEPIVLWGVLASLAAGLGVSAIDVARERRFRLFWPAALLALYFAFTFARAVAWTLRHDELSPLDHAYQHLLIVLLQAGVVFSLFLDLNETSLHGFYRDRLADLFLFDPRRDERLPDADLGLGKLAENAGHDLPFHLLCCAVNLPASDDRRVAERRVDSFVVSGTRIGSPGLDDGAGAGLASPGEFAEAGEPLGLPAAMAVSGAAVNPHFGAGVPAPVSALMTILNVRLGVWWANPRYLHRPKVPSLLSFTIWPVTFVQELLSAFDPRSYRALVSDGGHFENLGLYELVRRRCRYIVVSDASADPERRFADLGNAIRRCRTDFGADIELDTELLRADPATGLSGRHVVVGSIEYRGGGRGTLVYVKSSLTGDEPADVLQYRREHPAFPHESTADQDFDEAQFESYRKLGEHVGEEVFGTKAADGDLGVFFASVRDRWRPPAPDGGARFVELCREFSALEGTDFLQAANLLDHEQYPEIFSGKPRKGDLHAAFHHVVRQLQLMENFWIALRLGERENRVHPDNRGAMNLFRRWARSPYLRSVYPVVRTVYGQEFQRFCEEHLRLPKEESCLHTPPAVDLTTESWKACEGVVAYHGILGVIQAALPLLEEQAKLHVVELAHGGDATPVGEAIVANVEDAGAELFGFMVDNRYFYSGVAERLLSSIREAYPGRSLVMLPLLRDRGFDDDEWEGRVRYFQQLGFTASETSTDRTGDPTTAGYAARAWLRPPRASVAHLAPLPFLHCDCGVRRTSG
jgi:hypothetical protein